MGHRIYTRSGDDGSTGLADGSRVAKYDLRVATTGTVDETSSLLGLALAQGLEERAESMLVRVQHDLFDLGADLATPGVAGADASTTRVSPAYVERLERWIDEVSADLTPLTDFVLPGGTAGAACLHVARNVCRRAERQLAELMAGDADTAAVSGTALRYLNRLSDLLFVLAREANDGGRGDVLWQKGLGQDGG